MTESSSSSRPLRQQSSSTSTDEHLLLVRYRDGTCDEMDAETVFGERRDATEATKYKFVVDVDGKFVPPSTSRPLLASD